MGYFAVTTKSRGWVVTVHEANMQKAGLVKEEYRDPKIVAEHFVALWERSGNERTAAIVICESQEGLYHAHMACYGNTTTLKKVSETLYGSHVEPQKGGKKALTNYMLKEENFIEKGETVIYQMNIENIQDNTGNRSDLELIEELLTSGLTPSEIFEQSFRFYRYEKMIRSYYLNKRIKETPRIKEMYNEYHWGKSNTGKTYTYHQLCDKFGDDDVYLLNDYTNATTGGGGFDYYVNQPAKILFLDEYRGQYRYETLLTMLDTSSKSQQRCRYANIYQLWTSVYISSVYSLEEIYELMVPEERRKVDTIYQLKRRFNTIVYHYRNAFGDFKTFSMKAEDYIDKYHMIRLAREAEKEEYKALRERIRREPDPEIQALLNENKTTASAEELLASFGCTEAIPINYKKER